MDGSDDFYFDDITEADLAVADEVESKYIESQRTQALQRKASQSHIPPSKRQKTTHAHDTNASTGPCETQLNASVDPSGRLARSSSLHSAVAILPDLPLVNGYHPPTPRKERDGRVAPAPFNHNVPQRYPSTRPDAVTRNHAHQVQRAPRPPVGKPPTAQRVPATSTTRPQNIAQRAATPPVTKQRPQQLHSAPSVSASTSASRAATPPVSKPAVQRIAPVQAPRLTPAQRQSSGPQETVVVVSNDGRLEKELEDLRLKLEALQQEQAQMQETLRKAEDIRWAKEGEVTILRQGMQKTAQEHNAALAKMKAAKDAAEAMQLKIQQEKKEEIDRLKTQYTFKQHELETSGRGSPWSARSRKISKQAPPTPVRMPTQMREWNPLGIDKSSTGPIDFSDAAASSSQQPNGVRKGQGSKENRAESATAKPKLPGFVNAFDSPSPRAASQPSRAKGKQREGVQNGNGGMTAEEAERNFFAPSQPSSQNASSLASSLRLYQSPPSPPSSPLGQKLARRNGKHSPQWASPRTAPQSPMQDVEMPDSQEDADAEIVDEFPDMVWAAEVHRIILTHRRASSTQPTMQLLMGASLPDDAAPEHREAYARLSQSLLEVMGIMPTETLEQDHAIQSALDVLIQMADVLQACSALDPLLSLLGMLRLLVVLLPAFSRLMFVRPEGEDDKADVFFDVVCRTICRHLAPVEGGWSAPSEELAKETLGLLGDLAWVVPDEYESHLGSVPSHPGVLSALLAPTHPTWFLRQSVQTLVLFASHHGIFRSLLTIPDAPANVEGPPPKDFSKIPHIEQLAAYLRDTTRTGKEAELLKDAIMTFVVTLCMAHEDAVTILQQSHLLIPSVVAFLSHITTPLFEEEPELVNNAQQLEATVMRSVRSVSVLYTLVRGAHNSSFNLYNKLRRVATRDIPSMFDVAVVTLARLSWADPPLEASDEAKVILEEGIEITGILIEDIIDAPQLEDVWLAFQVDEERQLASQKSRDVEDRGGGQDEDEDLLLSQEV